MERRNSVAPESIVDRTMRHRDEEFQRILAGDTPVVIVASEFHMEPPKPPAFEAAKLLADIARRVAVGNTGQNKYVNRTLMGCSTPTGRNSLCPCGSKLKFKKCCIKKTP